MKKISCTFIFVAMLISSAAHSSCFEVSIKVNDKKPDGSSWDANGGSPDIKACFNDEWGYRCKVINKDKAYCKDTLECNLGVVYFVGSSTEVELIDLDVNNHDPIGNKQCNIGERCNLGNAVISFKQGSCE